MSWSSMPVNEVVHIVELFSFFEQECPREYDFKGESHNFWECLLVLDGELCVSADAHVYRLSKGMMIFHKPLEFHKFYVESDGAKIFVCSFTMEGELCDYFKNKVFALNDEQTDIMNSMLDYAHRKMMEFDAHDNGKYMYKYFYLFDTVKTYPQMLVSFIHQLLLSLADNGEITESYHTAEADVFRKAVRYMNANIGSQMSVEHIAEECAVSIATLKRIFARYTGIGIHKYFLQMKIKRATELMRDGLGVSETAEKLGFSSQAYFSAAYKRETGVSPSHID